MQHRLVKVLHCIRSMDCGGTENWLMSVLRNIDRQRFQFDFCALGGRAGTYAPEIESLGGRVLPLRRGRNLWAFSRRFRHLLTAGGYACVHVHPLYISGYLLRLAQAEGVRIRVAHSHVTCDGRRTTPQRAAYRWLMRRWVARYATHGLAVSRAAAQPLFPRHWERDPRFRILHCGIDLDRFRRPADHAAVRRELGIPQDASVIGHVGRFVPQKNHEGLVAIAAIIAPSAPGARFLLVGDGPLRPHIERLVTQRGLADRFVFCGARADVERMYAAMDLLLLPSHFEGLPLVAVEAQAAGVPVVAADIPGIAEGVAPVAGNCLFRPGAYHEAAARVLERLTGPRAGRLALDPQAQEFISHFDVRHTTRELERIYAQ